MTTPYKFTFLDGLLQGEASLAVAAGTGLVISSDTWGNASVTTPLIVLCDQACTVTLPGAGDAKIARTQITVVKTGTSDYTVDIVRNGGLINGAATDDQFTGTDTGIYHYNSDGTDWFRELGGGSDTSPLDARDVAFELTTPRRLTHCFAIGDSRLTGISSVLNQNAIQVAWAGEQHYWSERTTSGHVGIGASSQMNTGGDSPTASTYLPGNVNDWAFGGAIESEFTGSADSNLNGRVGFAQFFSGQLAESNFPTTYARLSTSQNAKYSVLVYSHPLGHTTPEVSLSWRGGGSFVSDPENIQSPGVDNTVDATGTWTKWTVEIPSDYTWFGTGQDPNLDAEITATVASNAGTVANEVIAFASAPWVEADSGTVFHNAAVSGRSIDGWIDPTILPPSVIQNVLPVFGENLMFWIDIGTNNPESNTREEHAEKLTQLIASLRSSAPTASIMLTTAYAASTDVGVPYYVLAARDVAAADPTILLIDTYQEMPDYVTGNGLGYYSDGTHYNATGEAAWTSKIGELIEAYAGGGGSGGNFLPLAGGTMSGDIDMDGNDIADGGFSQDFNQWAGDLGGPRDGAQDGDLADSGTLVYTVGASDRPVDGKIATYQVTIDVFEDPGVDSWIGTFQVERTSTFLTVVSALTEVVPFNVPANYSVALSSPAGASTTMTVTLTNNSGGTVAATISVEKVTRSTPALDP